MPVQAPRAHGSGSTAHIEGTPPKSPVSCHKGSRIRNNVVARRHNPTNAPKQGRRLVRLAHRGRTESQTSRRVHNNKKTEGTHPSSVMRYLVESVVDFCSWACCLQHQNGACGSHLDFFNPLRLEKLEIVVDGGLRVHQLVAVLEGGPRRLLAQPFRLIIFDVMMQRKTNMVD